jgi:hypothetical protein
MDEKVLNAIRILTRGHFDYQRERMRLDGMIGVKKTGELKKVTPEREEALLMEIIKRRDDVFSIEETLKKELAKEVAKHPLWNGFLKDVKGCGEGIAAVIITEIDINKAKYVSNIWSFAGFAPGKDKKKKGEKCSYNQFLRMVLAGRLGPSFLKCNSPYRAFYDNMRLRLDSEEWGRDSKNPSDKKHPKAGHQHRAANRYMVKMFLKDLYVAWRAIECLPVAEPYQEKYLGHRHAS